MWQLRTCTLKECSEKWTVISLFLNWCLAKRLALIDLGARNGLGDGIVLIDARTCLLYTSPSPRD